MGVAYQQVAQQVTMEQIYDVKMDKDRRLTTSPLGWDITKYSSGIRPLYVGRSVGWKRADGISNMAQFEKDAMASCKNPSSAAALIAGLKKAIGISKKYAGVRGTVVVNNKLYTRKNIEQKKG